MKRVFLPIMMVLIVLMSGCGDSSKHEGEARTPSASNIQKGRDYESVVDDFENKGFTNITLVEQDDLVTGWLTNDGEVESVSVDGNVEYSSDTWYPNDVEVIITYHTFPKAEQAESDEKNLSSESNNDKKMEIQSTELDEETLTPDNNEELAMVLSVTDEFDPIIKAFAEKYSMSVIEFDGYIADVTNYKDYNTRFNLLIYAGDYRTENFYGPNMQIENVGTTDFENIESSVNQNVHIVAKVCEYKESQGLLILNLISIEKR